MEAANYKEELHEIFEEQDEVNQIRQDERWKISDLSTALWADGIIHEKEVKIAEVEKLHKERKESLIRKLDEWLERTTKPLENDIEFFKTHLHVYHMRVLEEERAAGAKKESKTIKLQYRDLTCKKQQPEILINGKETDKAKTDPEFVKFVKSNNPEFIKEEVKWGDYKKTLQQKEFEGKLVYVDEAGQPIDFIKLVERGETYDWNLHKD
jgi:hypothetical protein